MAAKIGPARGLDNKAHAVRRFKCASMPLSRHSVFTRSPLRLGIIDGTVDDACLASRGQIAVDGKPSGDGLTDNVQHSVGHQ